MNTVLWQFSIMQNEKYFKKYFVGKEKDTNFTSTNKQTTKKHLKNNIMTKQNIKHEILANNDNTYCYTISIVEHGYHIITICKYHSMYGETIGDFINRLSKGNDITMMEKLIEENFQFYINQAKQGVDSIF